ncbi:MAG: response regulator [Opitutales bacterium]
MTDLHPELSTNERPVRVLLADDNAHVRTTSAILVQRYGYDVRVAANGTEALAEAEAFRPDVILLDLTMPGMDGWETAHAIRSRPWGKDVRLLAVTARDRDTDISRAVAAGFDEYLIKPVAPQQLRDALEALP